MSKILSANQWTERNTSCKKGATMVAHSRNALQTKEVPRPLTPHTPHTTHHTTHHTPHTTPHSTHHTPPHITHHSTGARGVFIGLGRLVGVLRATRNNTVRPCF